MPWSRCPVLPRRRCPHCGKQCGYPAEPLNVHVIFCPKRPKPQASGSTS